MRLGLDLEVPKGMRVKSLRILSILTVMIMTSIINQACSRKLDPEQPCGFVQSNELQRVSWKENLPVRFMIHNSVPTTAYDAIRAARDHWNEQLGQEVFKIEIYGVGGVNRPKQDDVNVIYWMDQWEPEKRSEQARTTIYWTGSRIYEADIRVNDSTVSNFTFHEQDLVDENGESLGITGVDIESLMIHEFGHAIGLAHREESDSVMQTMLADGQNRRQLSENDVSSVSCEYGAYKL